LVNRQDAKDAKVQIRTMRIRILAFLAPWRFQNLTVSALGVMNR
jgi:hypothetical protein